MDLHLNFVPPRGSLSVDQKAVEGPVGHKGKLLGPPKLVVVSNGLSNSA